ncbi:F-box only protein 30-like [Anneissia japonica]|uniref:F-box only protein 30-like n=1 Tax=Anneissia japonica TaxID=1529436 RepID=UPI0014255272|nr:F-box only protein 30-like [Anneissia japonica]
MASQTEEQVLLHSHCLKCYNYNCKVDSEPEKSCSMLSCDLDCGARFHTCKLLEHKLLCPFERVACLSAHCGCPMSVVRCLQVKHMQTCPAFVIQCGQKYRVEDWDSHFTCKKGASVHDRVCAPILERWKSERERKKDHLDKVFDDIYDLQQSKKAEKAEEKCHEKGDQVIKKEEKKVQTSSINRKTSTADGDKVFLYPEPPKTPLSPEPPHTPLTPLSPFSLESDFISRMPTEIMAHVGQFLDGESMYSLAKTSSHMFDLCVSLLDEKKGMVYLKWQKKDGTWKIKEPMWEFASVNVTEE